MESRKNLEAAFNIFLKQGDANAAIAELDLFGQEIRARTLREVADLIESKFPDPNPLSSIFKPYVGRQIVSELRRMADER